MSDNLDHGTGRRAAVAGDPSPIARRTYRITGGAGFIGSHLTDRLAARGDRVLVLDDMSTGSAADLRAALEGGRVRLVTGSVLDSELVATCMQEVDVCVHLAAAVGVKRIVDHPLEALLTNIRGTDVVLAAAVALGRKVLFASSSEVYGKRSAEGLKEDSDCTIGAPSRARWSYAIAKQFGESLGLSYRQDAGADVTTVRFFNVVGPRQSGAYGMVLPRFVSQALAGEPLTIYGDGTQSRCFTSVHDAVGAVDGLLSCDSRAGGTYNVGSATPIRVDELARRVIARVGSRSEIAYIPYAEAYGPGYEELGRRVPDTGALRALTGWEQLRTIDETIDEVVAASGQAGGHAEVRSRSRRTLRPVPASAAA